MVRSACVEGHRGKDQEEAMHVTSVSREEVDTLRRAFDLYDHDGTGRINVYQFSVILRSMFMEDLMFHSLLSDVVQECRKQMWVYFPDLLGTLVRNRHNPFYEEIWDRFVYEVNFQHHPLPQLQLEYMVKPLAESSVYDLTV